MQMQVEPNFVFKVIYLTSKYYIGIFEMFVIYSSNSMLKVE